MKFYIMADTFTMPPDRTVANAQIAFFRAGVQTLDKVYAKEVAAVVVDKPVTDTNAPDVG